MTTVSRYDGIAVWYDAAMNDPGRRAGLAEVSHRIVGDLLGPGSGTLLDVGTGSGIAATALRALGYTPIGVDLSLDQLRLASSRLPVVQGDAARLPVATGSVRQAFSTFVSSDLDDFAAAIAEVVRVLAPGGRYVTVCVHPCFDGNHTCRQDDSTVVLGPGYRTSAYAPPSHFRTTIRGAVGAWHRPLHEQLNTYLDAGLRLVRVVEDGTRDIPDQLGLSFVKA
jgi:SAM-dependent methyltransferase